MQLKAELEMKVEELMMDKQKTNRRLSELKELASRETNLRSSLEESHTTLLSRLQDMESVIESLRGECKRHSDSSNDLKSEMITLKDELAQETTKRQRLEDSYHILVTEKDKLLLNASISQSENQRVLHELTCLQTQFADLIGQLEQTQQLVENLSTSKRTLEEEKAALLSIVQTSTAEFDKIKCLYTDTKESETKLTAEKSALEDDFSKLKTEKENLVKDNTERKRKIDVLEQELKTVKQSLAEKNLEFISAADSLELELTGVKRQLEAMENEKQRVLKDKESLLEEVNQTVDMLMSERSRLQTEVQASCVEAESLRATCSRLELDKAQLLEKLGGLQQQQAAQCKVEVALNEMVEQKNKLAYENGKLRSTVSRLQQEISDVTRDQADITQLRRLTESLQAKYTKSQREISEYKISLQRLEGQSKMALEELEQKDHQLKVVQNRRDEVEREMGKLLGQIEDLEGRQLHKVTRYEKNMEEAKNVNKEIAGTLEAVMTSHTQLQSIVENLQVELGKRDSQISQLKNSRNKEHEEMKQEMRNYEEKVESLKQELKRERDKTGKKTFRELAEIRKQNENFSSRNQDLIKANSELRQKVANLEREKNEMKAKLSGQKHKLVYLYKAKKQLEENLNKMKAVREDIEELEQVREEYMHKNKEQGETITNFITQISSLQDDLRQLASAHSNTQHLLKRKEEALEKEQRIRDEMSKKYTECKKREEELFKKSHDSDEKLKEVHSESLEISKHLEEAQDWFKGQFDKLLTELTVSRQIQAKLEMGNSDQRKSLEMEKSRAHNAAERAKEMIQSSRKTIMELSDYARMADLHTRKHLSHHQDGLQAPAWTSKLTLKDLET